MSQTLDLRSRNLLYLLQNLDKDKQKGLKDGSFFTTSESVTTAVCETVTGVKLRVTFPNSLLPAEQQLGVVLALKVAVYEVRQQVLQDIGGVLQLALQHCHDK